MQNPIDKAAFWVGVFVFITGIALGPFFDHALIVMTAGTVVIGLATVMTTSVSGWVAVVGALPFALAVGEAYLSL